MITMMNIIVLLLSVLAVCSSRTASAFMTYTPPITSNNAVTIALVKNVVDKTNTMTRSTSLVVVGMVGGRGWDNSDYLSGLGGSDDDKKKAQEDYKEFSDRRASFLSRQGEIMNSPQGKAFLMKQQQREQQQLKQQQQMQEESSEAEEMNFASKGSGGGTRMGRMMAQAKRIQDQRRSQGGNMMGGGGGGGFNQQILSPLDDDDDDDDDEDDDE
ncbi:MAG: hypothetical protein ACI90V_005185 [Bacillariaceae sp.]|jgi:hypothetical protein